jgi:hypothetical protein
MPSLAPCSPPFGPARASCSRTSRCASSLRFFVAPRHGSACAHSIGRPGSALADLIPLGGRRHDREARDGDCVAPSGLRALWGEQIEAHRPPTVSGRDHRAHRAHGPRQRDLEPSTDHQRVVDKDRVAKYMPKRTPRPGRPSQTWGTFVRNHRVGTIAVDLLTVPTVTFNVLYVFFVLSLEGRRVLHVDVTAHPYAAWAAQQIVDGIGPDVPALLPPSSAESPTCGRPSSSPVEGPRGPSRSGRPCP